jgi:Zn-dependent protease
MSIFQDPTIASFLYLAVILVISLTIHEFSHAITADYFGDDTPRRAGRVTLNPLAHLDLMGSIVFLVAHFGWAKPVPINPYALQRRSPAAVMWVSLAGPFSNLMLAILAAIPLRFWLIPFANQNSPLLTALSAFLFQFVLLNLTLALFNLIPIPPLDGNSILGYFLPEPWARRLDAIQPYGPIILLVIVFLLPYLGFNVLSMIMRPALNAIMSLLLGGAA